MRRRELRRLAATRGSIENDRFQRLNKLKSVAELFQGFDMDGKRFVAERLCNVSLSPDDQDSISLLQEQEPLSQESPLQESSPQKLLPLPVYPIFPPLDVPVCIEHYSPLIHQF